MSLTRLAFRYRPVTALLTALLLAFGVAGLRSMPRREDPDLKGRFAQIIAIYPGATAAQVEELVTARLERTLREIDDVNTVSSASRPGLAVISVEAADRMTDSLDKLMDDMRERVADLRPSLPSGVLSVTVNDRFADTSTLVVAVIRPGASPRELEESAKCLRDKMRTLPEVAEAKLLGERQEVVTVALSSKRLNALNGSVTVDQIANAVGRRNVLSEVGGSVASGDARLAIAPAGEFRTEAEIGSIVVGQPNGAPVYLRDVADVTRGYADPPGFLMRVNGQPAVGLTMTMRKGQNITALGEQAQKVLADVKADLPTGTELAIVNDLPKSVERRVAGFFHELQLAVVIICAIMYLFMGLRSALLVGAMLPVSMLATFAAMWMAGRDIQQISISALIIALALVVDNSIVVLDNIEEKMAAGLPREQAAIEGAEELRGPLITSNLVAISSFLPLAFLPGGVGDFIRDLGVVTALSLSVSVLLNLTVTPLLCLRFLRAAREGRQSFVQRWLTRVVDSLREGKAGLAQWAFQRPRVVVFAAALAFAGSVSLIPKLGIVFFPAAERDQFVIDVWLPEGRDIRATERAVARVESLLNHRPGVRSHVAYIGQGGPRFYYNVSPEAPAANYAQIVVNTTDMNVTDRLVAELQKEARETIAGARVTPKKLEQGPPIGAPVAVRITGDDYTELRRLLGEVKTLLNRTPGAHSVHDSFGERPLRLQVDVDEDRAAAFGLSSASIAQATRLAFSGQTVSMLREGDKEIPIDLRLNPAERAASDLLDFYLPGAGGGIPLRQVASVRLVPEDGRLTRRNTERTVTVFAYSDGTRLASAILADVQKELARRELPRGYRIAYGGESEETGKSFGNLGAVFAAAIVFNIVVLVVQFNNWAVVLAVLSAVPLGVIGAVPGLYLARQNFGFMAFLGIAALGGIVTNHTIFIFHYAQEEKRRHGLSMTEALVDASRRRLRPILLTVLLSVSALLPQAFSGSKLWPPLDWAIIAGLLVSTFLTMIVVPSVFAVLSGRHAQEHDEAEQTSPLPAEKGAASGTPHPEPLSVSPAQQTG